MDDPSFEFVEGDNRSVETRKLAVKGVNLLCHQAALGSVPLSIKDPVASFEGNVAGFNYKIDATGSKD